MTVPDAHTPSAPANKIRRNPLLIGIGAGLLLLGLLLVGLLGASTLDPLILAVPGVLLAYIGWDVSRAQRLARNMRRQPGDYIFLAIVAACAALLSVLMAGIVYILVQGSSFTLKLYGLPFLWGPTWSPTYNVYGALPFITATLFSSMIALAIAVPVSLGIAIFLSEMSPAWLRMPLSSVVELLAAVPSVIFGFWGLEVLVPYMKVAEPKLNSLVPSPYLFANPDGQGMLTAGIILAIMIIPTIAALSREALLAVPQSQREAALGLGATRWESTRVGVLKYARSGIVGAVVLGLGRAVGETMAVTFVIGNDDTLPKCLSCTGQTMASLIANEFLDPANPTYDRSSLVEVALLLMVITLLICLCARLLIWRLVSKSQGREYGEGTSLGGWLRRRLRLRPHQPRTLEELTVAPSTTPGSSSGAPAGPRDGTYSGVGASVVASSGPVLFSSARDRLRRAKNQVMLSLMVISVVIALVPLGDIIYACWQNGHAVLSWNFLVGPENPASCALGPNCSAGGIGPAIQSTFLLMGMAAAWAIPVSVLAAIFLSEYGRGKVGRTLSFAMDVMSGVPSIVVGLFVLILFETYYASDVQSTYSQALALGVIMLPLVTRTAEEALKIVPYTLREAAWGLGITKHKTTTRVVLRSAIGPITTGSLLAAARIGGETAPLLFLGLGQRFSIFYHCTGGTASCFNNYAGPLGPFIYIYAFLPGSNNIAAAWGASLVFILMMLGLSLAARLALRGRLAPVMGGG
jgi:phosphate transport system permease protein